MNEQAIRWDDLQIVLAVVSSGSLSGAGRHLSMSHATVFRRLTEMEKRLGVRLFDRARSGYTPTPAGEELAAAAARIQTEVLSVERHIAGQDLHLSGSIRIATTDTLFSGLLAKRLAEFRQKYPQIDLEIVLSNQLQNLSKREADIAIRPTRSPLETLVGRRVIDITQAVYGQHEQWKNTDCPVAIETLSEHHWIGPDTHMGDITLDKWMAADGRSDNCRYRVDSMLGMQMAAREGAGITVLPCYLGDADKHLKRLSAPIPELATQLWLLTHPDLRRVIRIRTFLEEVGESLKGHEGFRP